MRHLPDASRWVAWLAAALAASAMAQPAPSRTTPGLNPTTMTDVGPPPAQDRDSVGAIVYGPAPPRPSGDGDPARATQTLGGPGAVRPVPIPPARDTDALRRHGAGSQVEN